MVVDFPDFVTGFLKGAFESMADGDPGPAKSRHRVRLWLAFGAPRPIASYLADYDGTPKELDRR